jgi:pimeloyl-ACP methyl ester carboxylesterase
MAADAESFLRGLGLPKVDLLGFSLGGMLAQVLAAQHPGLIRKIIIAGAAPRGGEEHLLEVVDEAFARGAPDVRLPLFFTPSEESQNAGRVCVPKTLSGLMT